MKTSYSRHLCFKEIDEEFRSKIFEIQACLNDCMLYYKKSKHLTVCTSFGLS